MQYNIYTMDSHKDTKFFLKIKNNYPSSKYMFKFQLLLVTIFHCIKKYIKHPPTGMLPCMY